MGSKCNSKKADFLDLNIINLHDVDVRYSLFYDQIFNSIIHKNLPKVGRHWQ